MESFDELLRSHRKLRANDESSFLSLLQIFDGRKPCVADPVFRIISI